MRVSCSVLGEAGGEICQPTQPLPHANVEPFVHEIAAATVTVAPTRTSASPESSALELTLRALRPILSRSEVTELCINRPGEAFIETRAGWERESLPFADLDWCRRLAKLVANSTAQ